MANFNKLEDDFKKLLEILDKAEEGLNYAINKPRYANLQGKEILKMIVDGIKNYRSTKNLNDLRSVMDKYKQSNMLTSGNTYDNFIWYHTVESRGGKLQSYPNYLMILRIEHGDLLKKRFKIA